jgi:hypothetical protein
LLAVVVVLLGAGPVEAVTLVTPDGEVAQPYQRWANRAKVPTPQGVVTVYPERCPTGPRVCYYRDGRRMYLDSAVEAVTGGNKDQRLSVRLSFFHELFHDFDEAGPLTDADRAEFMRIMRLRGPWRQDDHDASPNEAFADGAAACAKRDRVRTFETSIAFSGSYQPTARQHQAVCALIRRAGHWIMWRR